MYGHQHHHWWIIVGIVLLFLLIIAIVVAVWRCNSRVQCRSNDCRKNDCEKKEECEPKCCERLECKVKKLEEQVCCDSKRAALSVISNGAVPELDTVIYAISFLDPPLLVESPCNKWTPVTSTVDGFTDQVIGFTAPECGAYWVEYHVGLLTSFAITFVLINGQILLRSSSFFLDESGDAELGTTGQVLGKSFEVVLNKGDVVSVVLVSPSNNFIPIAPSDDLLAVTSTLSLSLIEGCCNKQLCSSNVDIITGATFVLGPNAPSNSVNTTLSSNTSNANGINVSLTPTPTVLGPEQSNTVVGDLVSKYQAGTLTNDGPNALSNGPVTQHSLFMHQLFQQFK